MPFFLQVPIVLSKHDDMAKSKGASSKNYSNHDKLHIFLHRPEICQKHYQLDLELENTLPTVFNFMRLTCSVVTPGPAADDWRELLIVAYVQV